MKKLLAVLVAGLAFFAPVSARAQDSKATIISSINTDFADNTAGAITAALLRTVTTEIVSSYVDYILCGAQGGTAYWNGSSPPAPSCLAKGTNGQILRTAPTPFWDNLANALIAGTGISITGTITPTITLSASAAMISGAVPNTRIISSGAGLTGGGDLSTDRTLSVNTNSVTNAMLAQAAAATLRGNPTGSTANVQDFTIQGLTNLVSPAATQDYIPIYDHTAGTIKNVTPAAITAASVAGVATLNTLTGNISWSAVDRLFTATGTYTPTSGTLYAEVSCYGAGGGGGGVANSGATGTSSAGAGGAGGKSVIVLSAASIGASKAIAIGAAGAGGAASQSDGAAGGDTTFGSTLCVGKGGSGGKGAASNGGGSGGAGGVAGTGTITGTGQGGAGGTALAINTVAVSGALGGSCEWGGGGGGLYATTATGPAGTGYCSGGGGGTSTGAGGAAGGGAGAAGVVVVREYVLQ